MRLLAILLCALGIDIEAERGSNRCNPFQDRWRQLEPAIPGVKEQATTKPQREPSTDGIPCGRISRKAVEQHLEECLRLDWGFALHG